MVALFHSPPTLPDSNQIIRISQDIYRIKNPLLDDRGSAWISKSYPFEPHRFRIDAQGFGVGQWVAGPGDPIAGVHRLQVDGLDFSTNLGEDGFIKYGSVLTTESMAHNGLLIHREIDLGTGTSSDAEYVLKTVDYFENSTGSEVITVSARILGNVETDGTTTVFATSDGDQIVEATDEWLGTADSHSTNRSPVIHVFRGVDGIQPTNIEVIGDNIVREFLVQVPANQTVSLAHFTIVGKKEDAILAAEDLITRTAVVGASRGEPFDNFLIFDDHGDAPSPYPASASHVVRYPAPLLTLGSTVDREESIQRSDFADGDGSDEDGVMFGTIQVGTSTAALNVLVESRRGGRIDAWIDFNQDQQWTDDEQILQSAFVLPGLQTLNYSVPTNAVSGNTFARVRLSLFGGLSPFGQAPDGEVEDYLVNVLPLAPQVEQIRINDSDHSRSNLTSVSVQFDSRVDHETLNSAFRVVNISSSIAVGSVNVAASDVRGKTIARLTFDGASTLGRSNPSLLNTLDNGNYRLDIDAGFVVLAAGNLAAMTSDHQFGGHTADEPNNDGFFRWFGDFDGDGNTDFNDFAKGFLPAFGTGLANSSSNYRGDLDFDGDGNVDFLDFTNGFLPAFGTGRP